jgi:hypothetical protein
MLSYLISFKFPVFNPRQAKQCLNLFLTFLNISNLCKLLIVIIIVSKSLSETTVCQQMFIVKTLITNNMDHHPIYMKRKEGARELAARETERECVREREDS